MMRVLSERTIEMQQNLFLCFIDYSKAFDNVKREKLFEMLEDIQIDGKDLKLIRNLYWKHAAAIRISSHERRLRELEAMPGFVVGGNNIKNLRYADDTVLMATSEVQLHVLVDKVALESAKRAYLLTQKRQCMIVTKKRNIPTCNIRVHNTKIKQLKWFSYFGSLITSDSRCEKDIKRRIAML